MIDIYCNFVWSVISIFCSFSCFYGLLAIFLDKSHVTIQYFMFFVILHLHLKFESFNNLIFKCWEMKHAIFFYILSCSMKIYWIVMSYLLIVIPYFLILSMFLRYQICYNMFYVDCIVNLLSLKILINYYMICGIYYPFISRTFKLFIYFIIPYLIWSSSIPMYFLRILFVTSAYSYKCLKA